MEPGLEHWGSRRMDEPTPSEIRHLMAYVKTWWDGCAVERR